MLHVRVSQSLNFNFGAFSVVFFALIHSCRGQHQVIGPSQPIIAMVGDDVVLPCHLDPVMNVYDMILEWARPDLDPRFVLVWRNGFELESQKHSSYQGRTSLFMSELKLGNVSLKLSKVKTSDEGKYRCFIPELNSDSNIQLVVGATSSPVIQMSRNISGVELLCKSEGWYPEPEVLWLDGEGNLLSAGPPETVRGPDDLYTVSSRVTVEKRHSNRFTCRVQQENINQTREAHIHVPGDFFPDPPSSSSSATIAGLVVVVTLLILSVVFGVWKWRQNKIRNKKHHEDEETQKGREEKKNHSEQQSLMDREQLTADRQTENDLDKEEKGPETQIDEETHRGESTDVLIQFSLEGGKQTNRHFAEGRTENDFDKETETEPNNQRGAALNPAEREEESNRGNEEDETNSVNGNTEQLMEERQTENNLQTEEGQEDIKSTAQYLMEEEKHGEQQMVDRETVNNLDKEKETLKTKNREEKEWERKVSRLEGQMKDSEEKIKKVKEQLEEVDRQREETLRKIHSVNMEEDEDTMKDLEKKKTELQKQLQKFETTLEVMKKEKNIMVERKNKATKDRGQKKGSREETRQQAATLSGEEAENQSDSLTDRLTNIKI